MSAQCGSVQVLTGAMSLARFHGAQLDLATAEIDIDSTFRISGTVEGAFDRRRMTRHHLEVQSHNARSFTVLDPDSLGLLVVDDLRLTRGSWLVTSELVGSLEVYADPSEVTIRWDRKPMAVRRWLRWQTWLSADAVPPLNEEA